jgi:hypothetical protein
VQALNEVIVRYNNSTTARNTAVEGNERMAMQFLVTQSDEFRQMLEALWRTYKVRESPMNAMALAKPWLRGEGLPTSELGIAYGPSCKASEFGLAYHAVCRVEMFGGGLLAGGHSGISATENPRWHGYLTPSPSKNVWWLRRVQGAFEARIAKVKASTGKMPSLRSYAVHLAMFGTRTTCGRDSSQQKRGRSHRPSERRSGQAKFYDAENQQEEIHQCCMFFASIYPDIANTISNARLQEVVNMFTRGSAA